MYYRKKTLFSPWAKQNKYHAKTNVYEGRAYHSIKESNHAMSLDMMTKATNPDERVKSWTPQFIVDIYLDGPMLTTKPTPTKLFRIIPDFLVEFEDGHKEVHEVKSSFTAKFSEWRTKWKILVEVMNNEHPDWKLVVIE